MTQSKVKSKGEFAIPQNENEFQEKIKKRLEGRKLKASEGSSANKNHQQTSRIIEVKREEKHPNRRSRPDLTIYHTELKMEWRKLSNPFFVECKLSLKSIQKNLIQLIKYKHEENQRIEKYGKYHITSVCPSILNTHDPWSDSNFYSYPQLERTLWHLGLGLLKKGLSEKELIITFNEHEQVVIV